ncbi:MAG: Holliday junction branch migration protein RuvA [bacterium]|nr:Holliday junction branch migration protein RuvA [bacterium]
MISELFGQISRKGASFLVIRAGGVGYKVYSSPDVIHEAQGEVLLFTYLAVRENALDLYGFLTEADADFFQLLLTVSGVGPKSALSIISTAPSSALKCAIARGEASELSKTFGIGKKIAEKLVIDLRDKCAKEVENNDIAQTPGQSDVIEALVVLGYNADEARATVRSLPKDITGIPEQIKEALRRLG